MAQIAQQDNLIIEITGALSEMDQTTKQKLIDCIKVGTITDVIVVSTEAANIVNHGKVLGYKIATTAEEPKKYSIVIMEVHSGKMVKVLLN